MGLIATGEQAASNTPPAWLSVPAPTFEDSTAGSYDLTQHVNDADGDTITYALNGASSALPTGVTLDSGGTLNASTSVSSGSTSGVIIDADDGINPAVASSSFTIEVTDTGEDAPTIIVRKDGTGDYTTIQAAIDAASAGDIIEVRTVSTSTREFYNEAITLGSNGTDGNEIILRARQDDPVTIYTDNTGNVPVIEFVNNSYWKFIRINFGRDDSLNGWVYGTNAGVENGDVDPPEGRFAVEHWRWGTARPGDTSHHITFQDCVMYGGNSYDGGYFDTTVSHFGFFGCSFFHQGINAGAETPNRAGNTCTWRGSHGIFEDCYSRYGGHDGIHIESPWNVARRCHNDGSWVAYKATNPGRGNRALNCEGAKGVTPWGPNLMELNVVRNADEDLIGDAQPAAKWTSYRGITRRNFVFDNLFQTVNDASGSSTATIQALDEHYYYNNTCVENGYFIFCIDKAANLDEHFIDHVYKNNISVRMGTGHPVGNEHIRWLRNNTTKRAGDADDWRGAVFDNNIFHVNAAGTFEVRMTSEGGATVIGTVADVETEWPGTFTNNQESDISFTVTDENNETLRQSFVYDTVRNAFILGAGSAGKDENKALTQASGAGTSSSILFVDDAKYFYAGADSNTWDLGYFGEVGDWIKVGSNSPVQINEINYETGRIVLASSITWSDNDDVWLCDMDGSDKLPDIGANPQVT